MHDDTHAAAPSDRYDAVFGWCAWHGGHARGVRLIRVEEAGSGPCTAGSLYACPPCREKHGLIPLADRPLADRP
ncbi:hypothetical protein [Streptomyces sp. NPDC059786]|uniref:hypothetical protein n=1 Tax=Streptomyces sp. NPDC059786 TaxID=3346946 RepID=UPI00364D81BE